LTPNESSKVCDFLDAYRAAFASFDVPAIAGFFVFPCQITSDADAIAVTTVANREEWLPELERLLAAYRGIGVHSADVVELRSVDLTERLAQATVRWRLSDAQGRTIYDFDASYTLVDRDGGMQITAIAHNEIPRLRAAIEGVRAPHEQRSAR
jgi:hypothetical protein